MNAVEAAKVTTRTNANPWSTPTRNLLAALSQGPPRDERRVVPGRMVTAVIHEGEMDTEQFADAMDKTDYEG